MEEASPGGVEKLFPPFSSRPRDLLRRFTEEIQIRGRNHSPEEESGDIELNLGLSLGGRFGADPIEKNRLVRSSTIGGLATIPGLEDLGASSLAPSPNQTLTRTVSLPTETEEDRRKRKEMQSLRRLEAKRKRFEKQRNLIHKSGGKDGDNRREREGSFVISVKGKGLPVASLGGGPPQGVPADPSSEKMGVLVGNLGMMGFTPSSQGSIGSQGSSSSGVSDMESRPAQGLNNGTEARSPGSVQSLPEHAGQRFTAPVFEQRDMTAREGVENKNPYLRRPKEEDNGVEREMGRAVMEEMPSVSTTGDGPNGRRIEGFLYKYKKGEEVRIVCVCHGSFLSPAEFVKHAGGGDVAHPLRHIVVNPSSPFL